MGHLIHFKTGREGVYLHPICGAMGEGMGMGMGGNGMGMSCPPPPPPPSPPSPAAIPNLDSRPSGALPGSVYVASTALFYVSAVGGLFTGVGVAVDTPGGALVGSVFVDGEVWYYIDAVGTRRSLQNSSLGAKDGAALQGSTWVESTASEGQQWQYIGGTNRYAWWNGF